MNNTTAEQIKAQYRHAFKYRTDLNNVLTPWHLIWAGIPKEVVLHRFGEDSERAGYNPRAHFGSRA